MQIGMSAINAPVWSARSISMASSYDATVAWSAPIRRSTSGAQIAPAAPNRIDTPRPTQIACTAVRAAARSSCSPIRRATIAVTDMPSPIAIA